MSVYRDKERGTWKVALHIEDASGKLVTATAEFTPDKADGTAEVTFEFDASKIEEGVELVVFEECLDVNGNVVAGHQDIDDDDQTVVVDNPETPKIPDEPGKSYDKTGVDTSVLFAAGIVLIASGAACGIYAIRKRKQASSSPTKTQTPRPTSPKRSF